jgi:tol-pal system protein YbgF
MTILATVRPRGSGFGSGPRGAGRLLAALLLVALPLSGCATKRDIRDLQEEVRALAAQQRAALATLEALNLSVQDTLRGQSDALLESRGEILRRLRLLEEQLTTLQELTGQNQRALAALRDLLESQRTAGLVPTRTDTPPGQALDPRFQAEPSAGGAEETYNAAVTQFQRGQFNTARRAFQQFLQQYPNHRLAPGAHFYLADILAQENRTEEAIQGFLRVQQLFPEADKVPDAYYRVGVLYIQLQKLDDARRYLQMVVNSYPDSGAALLARERLAEIG